MTILTELVDNTIGLITLNRPESANALNQRMAEDLATALAYGEKEPAIRVLVLTGAGGRAFCAGADLKERKGMSNAQWHAQHAAFEKALGAVLHCKKPVIAAVNAAAMGGGMELALACDFIYASENARFGLTEATLGIMPGMGGTQTLSRAVGTRRAKEMLYLGKIFSAGEAYELGMVNRVYAPDALLESAMATALAIADNAPLALAAIKRAVDEGEGQPLPAALQTELRYYNNLLESRDRHEGINAWNEKRKPEFTGT